VSYFIHQITSGIAGWLTFEQMQVGIDNLREAELAKPVDAIARGRGYEVKGEFPLPKEKGQRGAPPCIDFVMVNRKRKAVVALELKYKKTGKRMAGSLGNDAARLNVLSLDMINAQIKAGRAGAIIGNVDGFKLERAVIVVWHQSAIVEHMRSEPEPIRKQFLKLVKAMLPDNIEATTENFSRAMLGVLATKPVGRSYGSLRAGSTISRRRFWVASFLHQASWSTL
jgi:hypothetical protein